MDIRSDLKDSHDIMASMSDITVRTAEKNYRPVGVDADVFTRRDTTHAVIDCGDFHLNMDVHGGYKQLLSRFAGLHIGCDFHGCTCAGRCGR